MHTVYMNKWNRHIETYIKKQQQQPSEYLNCWGFSIVIRVEGCNLSKQNLFWFSLPLIDIENSLSIRLLLNSLSVPAVNHWRGGSVSCYTHFDFFTSQLLYVTKVRKERKKKKKPPRKQNPHRDVYNINLHTHAHFKSVSILSWHTYMGR